MNCNSEIHKYLIENGDIICSFCYENMMDDEELQEFIEPQNNIVKYIPCCENQNTVYDDNKLVCQKCGSVHGYETAEEYIDFYSEKHKLRRKSFYQGKYHINNTIVDIRQKYKINISYHQKYKIDRVFIEVGKIINEVNIKRKGLISINFILRKVLSMLKIPFEDIPISK